MACKTNREVNSELIGEVLDRGDSMAAGLRHGGVDRHLALRRRAEESKWEGEGMRSQEFPPWLKHGGRA